MINKKKEKWLEEQKDIMNEIKQEIKKKINKLIREKKEQIHMENKYKKK